MKRNTYLLLNSVLAIILVVSVINLFNSTKVKPINLQKYSIIEKSLTKINENLSIITKEDDHKELKTLKKAEEIQRTAYNNIIKDIKACQKEYDKSNKSVLLYRNNKNVSIKEFEKLDNFDCLKQFDKYSEYQFTKDEYMNKRLQSQIDLILNVTELPEDYDFHDLLEYKSNEIYSIANLTEWLKIEYNTYK